MYVRLTKDVNGRKENGAGVIGSLVEVSDIRGNYLIGAGLGVRSEPIRTKSNTDLVRERMNRKPT